MDLKQIRNHLRMVYSILFIWVYIPHLVIMLISGKKRLVYSDLDVLYYQIGIELPKWLQLVYQLHNNRYYRNVFYHRCGPVYSSFLRWYRPGDKYFSISATTIIGPSFWIAHPFSTIINAESIGKGFSCIHNTTIGDNAGKRPIIGNNVSLGASVIIIGDVRVGNNVTIGAGSVVVKDIPDNCIAVGNPCKPIKYV